MFMYCYIRMDNVVQNTQLRNVSDIVLMHLNINGIKNVL